MVRNSFVAGTAGYFFLSCHFLFLCTLNYARVLQLPSLTMLWQSVRAHCPKGRAQENVPNGTGR